MCQVSQQDLYKRCEWTWTRLWPYSEQSDSRSKTVRTPDVGALKRVCWIIPRSAGMQCFEERGLSSRPVATPPARNGKRWEIVEIYCYGIGTVVVQLLLFTSPRTQLTADEMPVFAVVAAEEAKQLAHALHSAPGVRILWRCVISG